MSNLKMSLTADGLLNPGALTAWTREKQQQINRGVATAMATDGRVLAKKADDQARSALKIRKKNFPNIRAKVYAKNPALLPALRIYSNVPWLGIHARGGVITGKNGPLLIPLIRIGFKAFKRVVDTVLRNGAGFFKQVNGKVLLFAEYQPEYGQPLAKFRRLERAKLGGARIKKGQSIPIAVLVPQVTIRKSINLEAIVRQGLPGLVRSIEQAI